MIASIVMFLLALDNKLSKAAKTIVTWFIGLGAGMQPEEKIMELEVVRKFNASQDKIDLRLYFSGGHTPPVVTLRDLIAAGNAPDIVGPVGLAGPNVFPNQWLDLTSLVKEYNYDLKRFPKAVVDMYREGNSLVGLPFSILPSVLYYDVELFDKTKLNYPPSKFGQKYLLDGNYVDWDWDTLAIIAKRLTHDKNGKDGNDTQFDPDNIVQFGFIQQWATMRSDFSTFGNAQFWDLATGKVSIPESWYEKARWIYNGLWKDYFIPNHDYLESDLLKPHAFASGHVAMAETGIWYNCCLLDMKQKWELGVVPAYKGKYYSPLDPDTFLIYKTTNNPDAAFKVLMYLLNEAAEDLLTVYNEYPARPDLQKQSMIWNVNKYPFVKHWEIVPASIQYAVVPNHDSYFPNTPEGVHRLSDFYDLLYSDTGKDIDVDKELDKLEIDLQKIVNAQPTATPTMITT